VCLSTFYPVHLFIFTSVIITVILFSVEARNQFKEFVNTLAVIRNEEVIMHSVLVKYYLMLDIRYFLLQHVA
jgi:hypothetical protein